MPHLTFHLFGAPRLQCDGAPVRIVRRRAVACAVYLAMTGQDVSRDALAALFWPETDPYHARADLRRTLHLLHQTLGPERLVTEQERVRFQRDADLWLDVEHFRHLLAACQSHGHHPQEVCGDCLPLLAAAAVLYRDDFLAGFTLPDAPEFDHWQWLEGEELRRELASALARLVRGHTSQGEFAHAIAYARRWVALDPLDEPAQRWLMQLYAWSGERSTALQQYQICAHLLAQELDVQPEPATRQLEQAIRAGRPPAPATAEQLGVVPSRGQHRRGALTAPSGEDELRMVTVLCAGLRPAEPPDDDIDTLAAQTEQLLAMAGTACAPYGGRVERVPGGDVLAIFGLDCIHEDDAERAIRAGLAIQQAARTQGLGSQGQALGVQIGINTGMAYCARPGPTAEAEVLLMGGVVNLAARLRNRAGSGGILVGSPAYRSTRGVFDYAALELALPGFARPVTAYQVLRLRSRITKARGIEGLRAALVGRDAEMNQLKAVMTRVLAGQGQLVLISGPAGVGKSRLVAELKEDWASKIPTPRLTAGSSPAPAVDPVSTISWLEGRCLELATAIGYWPFVDMLRHTLGEADDGDEPTLARHLCATLQALAMRGDLTAEQLEEIGPLLGRLLSLRFGNDWDDRARRVAPKQVRQRTFDAVRMFVAALARGGPVALIFEDLHWVDAVSLDLIGHLMAALASVPLLLVCVYRPEQALAGAPLLALAQQRCPNRCTALQLHELSLAQSRQLLASLLSIEQLPEQTRSLILDKAQGNPFFLEEIVRAQIDSGLLFRHEDSWRAQAEITALNTPETVQSVILSRVDRLPPELKHLLKTAAVMGRFFQRRLLAALAPPGLNLEEALAALSSLALIYQERSSPEVEYSFRHVLVQDAIYRALPGRRRASLHQQVAESLETSYGGNLGPHIEQLAHHYGRSNAAEKAIEYLVKAGEKAQAAYFNDEAVGYFQRALTRLDGLASADGWAEADTWRLAALKGLGIVYSNVSNLAEAEAYLHRAIALARKIGAPPLELAQLYGWFCRALRWQSRCDELIHLALEGLAQLGDDTQSLEAAILYGNLLEAYYYKDDRAQYHAIVQRLAQFLTTLPYSDDLFANYGYMLVMYRDRNEIEEVLKLMRFVEQGLRDGHNPANTAWMHMWQIPRYLEAIGDMRSAIAHNELGLARSRQLGDPKEVAWGLNHLAERCLSVGQLTRAREAAEESLVLHKRLGLAGEIMESTHILAGIGFCQGELGDATELIETALDLGQRTGFYYGRGFQRTLLGRLYLAQGQRAEAQAQFQFVLETDIPDARRTLWMISALAGLEATYPEPVAFRACCREIESRRPELGELGLRQWWLEPAAPDIGLQCDVLEDLGAEIEPRRWEWIDQFGDCAYALADGLVIRAANCRDLWANNSSAPRLVRAATGDFAVQITCCAAMLDRPAIGGLLLWQDKANYLRLTWGQHGPDQVALAGSLDNRNLVIGRGALSNAGCIVLRLERWGDEVRALCSADGRQWCRVGQIAFPAHGPLVVGLHALGQIDRMMWPGAYPEGTAIRFAC
jgi:DNA-binding SARP family transcriptional activator